MKDVAHIGYNLSVLEIYLCVFEFLMMLGFKNRHLVVLASNRFLFLFELSVSILIPVLCSFPMSAVEDEC